MNVHKIIVTLGIVSMDGPNQNHETLENKRAIMRVCFEAELP